MFNEKTSIWEHFVKKNSNVSTIMADTLPVQLDLMQRGYVDALVGQLPYSMGYHAAMTAVTQLDKLDNKDIFSKPYTILGTHQLEVLRVSANSTQEDDNTSSDPFDFEGQDVEQVEKRFVGLSIHFAGATKMSVSETFDFERLLEDWFVDFFRKQTVQTLGAGKMETRTMVTGQDVTHSGNTVTFDQSIAYSALEDTLDPQDYLIIPYLDVQENRAVSTSLAGKIKAFNGIHPTVPRPALPSETRESEEKASPLIAMSVLAGSLVVVVAVLVFQEYKRGVCTSEQRVKSISSRDHIESIERNEETVSSVVALAARHRATSGSLQWQLPTFKEQVGPNERRKDIEKDMPVADARPMDDM